MAYEFDLGDLEGPYTDSEGSQIVEFILGVDAEADLIEVMSIILFPTDQVDVLELCFGIRTKFGTDLSSITAPDYSKEGAAKCIPPNRKSEVLDLISKAVTSIVTGSMPYYIIMETFYPNLPPRALEKYSIIGAQIIICGYVIGDQFIDAQTGINYWLFKKRD